jgi:hypothetical protein
MESATAAVESATATVESASTTVTASVLSGCNTAGQQDAERDER